MTLRPLTAADVPRLAALDQRCFCGGIAYSAGEIRSYLSPQGFHRGFFSGAGAREKLAGFIMTEFAQGWGHVITVDVDAAWRRQGLGERLLRDAESHYRSRGASGMRLESAVNNGAALALYLRLGYRVRQQLPGYYAGDLDGVRLVLEF